MHGHIEQTPANDTLLRIVGMSRSGNHAILNWIVSQLPGRWCFLNCAEPNTNPFETARLTEDGSCFRTNDPTFDLDAHRAGRLSRKDWLVVSHEDTFLKPAFGSGATARQLAWSGHARRRLDVLILRDPYNLFASRRRFGHQTFSDPIMVRMWKQHARAFLGDKRATWGPILGLSYNAWASDRDYRADIAETLGLEFTDESFHEIARCGGGSSFDGTRFDGEPHRMDLFDRWRHYRHDAGFRALFDSDVRALAAPIFGPPPDELVGSRREYCSQLSAADY